VYVTSFEIGQISHILVFNSYLPLAKMTKRMVFAWLDYLKQPIEPLNTRSLKPDKKFFKK
jgi:hypothetical protein